jgi:hypothetical protein
MFSKSQEEGKHIIIEMVDLCKLDWVKGAQIVVKNILSGCVCDGVSRSH